MNLELGIILILSALLIFQHIFYLLQIQKFTDKVMSGNYTTYVQTESLKSQDNTFSGTNFPLPQDEGPDELEQLNRMLSPPF